MIIYFYLLIPLLFARTDSSSIRGRNNKNDLVPFMSSRSVSERDFGREAISSDPFFLNLRLPSSEELDEGGKDKKKKRPLLKKRNLPDATKVSISKSAQQPRYNERQWQEWQIQALKGVTWREETNFKRISKLKSLRKRQRTRRELQIPKLKSIRGEHSNSLQIPHAVNVTERLQNITNSIPKVDILRALSDYSKKIENRRSNNANLRDHQRKDTALNRNHHSHHLSEPLHKMVYPITPKPDRHPHKYTYRDLITDRERLEEKIKYIKNMLSINDSVIDDAVRVRRRSDSDRTANRIAKMFLTLSAVNDRRKPKCEEDNDEDGQDVWQKERKGSSSRKSSSSNEERYRIKKWVEFMKNKRRAGKTCPCMAMAGEERDVFPLEQKLPKGYLLMERQDSSEESSETYGDPYYSSRDKPNRDGLTRKRFNKSQEDQDGKVKGLSKGGKKKPDMTFTDLELYRSRAKQILRNAEDILDKIKEEEEKRIAAPNLFMNQLKELTSTIQGDPRNNENDLIRKLQKNLGWGPLAKSDTAEGNQFLENMKSFILDPYEKAKALTDESTRKLSSYLLRNLGKIQDPVEERVEAVQPEDENVESSPQVQPENEKPTSDSLTKEATKDPEKSEADRENQFKQRMEDIIRAQQMKLDEQNADESKKKAETAAAETVRENQEPNLPDRVAMPLKDYDVDRNSETQEKTTKDEVGLENSPAEKPVPHPEGETQGENGDGKSSASGNMPKEEKLQEEILEILKTIQEDMHAVPGDREKVESQRKDDGDPINQNGGELTQSKHDSEGGNEQEEVQEVATSSSGEISERDENDVLSSSYLANNDFLNPKENQESGPLADPSWTDERKEDAIKPNDETVSEQQKYSETEKSGSDESKELANLDTKETVGLEEPMEGKGATINQEPDEMIQVKDHEPLEYADLVKEETPDQTREASPNNESREEAEEMEMGEETLRMEQSNESTAGREGADGDSLLKSASDPDNVEENDGQLPSDENVKDLISEKAVDDDQDEHETPLRAENPETPREEPKEATFLKDDEDEGKYDEVRAENPAEEIENQGLAEIGEGSQETLLEAEGRQNLEESQPTEDETERKTSLEMEEERSNEDGSDLALKAVRDESLEDIKTPKEATISQEDNDSQSSREFSEIAKDEEGSEDTLKSENVAEAERNQMSQEGKESTEEGTVGVIPGDENLKLEKSANDETDETTAGKEGEKETVLKASEPKENDYERETEEVDSEDVVRADLRSEDEEEERSREIQASRSEENAEETPLRQENPEEAEEEQNSNETVKSASGKETEDNIEDMEGGENLKAANPGEQDSGEGVRAVSDDQEEKNLKAVMQDGSQEQENVKAVMEDGSQEQENVKAVMEDGSKEQENVKALMEDGSQEQENMKAVMEDGNQEQENVKAMIESESQEQENVKAVMEDGSKEQENVKAVMENEENLEDGEVLRAENSQERVEERNSNEDSKEEGVKAVLGDRNQENLDETLKSERTGNSDTDDVLNAEDVLKEQKQDEKATENEENVATQTEDETLLREALSQENMEEDETLKAETPEEESYESLRSAEVENLMRAAIADAYDQDPGWGVSEILRDNSDNEIDGDERVKSANFDETGRGLEEQETLMDDLFGGSGSLLREAQQPEGDQLSDLLQIPNAAAKPGARLKVPKSIAKIMNDLEGKTKDDITSIQNLNPDKIDHIIDKIDEAEQKNLRESQEVDCMKECACAEGLNDRSRNIGRYEIVKDFLHWMKDLQLNRVLSDD